MNLDQLDQIARLLAYPVGAGILANGLEEVWIDANYFLRGLHRRKQRAIPLAELRAAPSKRIAIMVAAWKEAEVIEQMLDHNLRSLDYDPELFDIFVGTYCNDSETQQKVDLVTRRARNVHKIVVPHDGPTCKADCLNWIYQGIVLDEQRRDRRYDILLMHDAEDLIHPLALRLYARLIPEHDFVQTPVFSLPLAKGKLVAGTYIDEFAEHHLKDMLVREAIGGMVPSAGVGSGFARDAFEQIAGAHGQKPFNPESLTEDYEIGLKFRLAGKKVHFACRTVEREVESPGPRGGVRKRVEEEYIATREYFPDQLGASVRQRSRWILGISLQTWAQLGWQGPAAVLYNLYRDRKALLTNSLLLFAYGLMVYFGGRTVAAAAGVSPWALSKVVRPASLLSWLLGLNVFFLAWRTTMKVGLVARLYGLAQGLLSAPRLVLGNFIGLWATGRAVSMYLSHRLTGRPLRWLKTTHAFPSHEMLRAERRRLGEFLLDRRALSADDLDQALELQRATSLPLGEVLTVTGVVPAREVSRALADQLEMTTVEPDFTRVPRALLERLPEEMAEALELLPLSRDGSDAAQVAFAADPLPKLRQLVEEKLGCRVVPVLASGPTIARARRRAYRTLLEQPCERTEAKSPPLGAALVAAGHLDQAGLATALAEQQETGERLGDLLLRRSLVSSEAIAQALNARRSSLRLPYRAVRPEEVDVEALTRLGYGLCAFYSLVPLLRSAPGDALALAAGFPLHPQVLRSCAHRLGVATSSILAPTLDVRLALAIGSRQAWPVNVGEAVGGMDGAELRLLAQEPQVAAERLMSLAGRARKGGRSPIDQLEDTAQLTPLAAARLRSRTLGLTLFVSDKGTVSDASGGLLPPGLAQRHGILVRRSGPDELLLAAPRPTPRLAAELAALFPAKAIAWQVLAHGRLLARPPVERAAAADLHP
jgi:bacteriophage N4 adsorption protein B